MEHGKHEPQGHSEPLGREHGHGKADHPHRSESLIISGLTGSCIMLCLARVGSIWRKRP